MNGHLYIVSTPIGNLKDITLRALETLEQVDFILCEDTRITARLLNNYNISKKLVSFNTVSEKKKISIVIGRINSGETCALVSDAGTPAISDPGIKLISESIKKGIEIIPIPGATAFVTALTISGLPADSIIFEGYLPQKKGRKKKLTELSEENRTIVLYESTYRINKLINELAEYLPDRYVVICRELTKKFEETWRGYPGKLKEVIDDKITKGEFVVVIAPKSWKVNYNSSS